MGIADELEAPQCLTCRQKDPEDFKCPAYPFGIPLHITSNQILHTKIEDDQIGDAIYTEV